MEKFYLTFGQSHFHEVDGKVFDKDCVAIITAEDYSAARAKVHELFGEKWCFLYKGTPTAIDLKRYFPRGEFEV